jgi:hypothetical protein
LIFGPFDPTVAFLDGSSQPKPILSATSLQNARRAGFYYSSLTWLGVLPFQLFQNGMEMPEKDEEP